MSFPEPLERLRDAVAWPVLPVTPVLAQRKVVDLEPFTGAQIGGPPDQRAQNDLSLLSVSARSARAVDLMQGSVVTIGPDKTVLELEALLLEHTISGVPVTEDGILLGVVTQADLVQHHYGERKGLPRAEGDFHTWLMYDRTWSSGAESSTRVCEIMTPFIYFASEDATVAEVLDLMLGNHIHRVLITRDRRLVGVITTTDILKHYRAQLDKAG